MEKNNKCFAMGHKSYHFDNPESDSIETNI